MKEAMRAVRAFMEVGQPDMVATGLTRPQSTKHEAALIRGMAERLAAWADALKEQGSTGSALGVRLMVEELGEVLEAMVRGDMVKFADGLADLVWVTLWTAVAHGVPMVAVWREVEQANMAKFPVCATCAGDGWWQPERVKCPECTGKGRIVLRDAGGKVRKPEGWTPPDIMGVLALNRSADQSAPRWPMPPEVQRLIDMPRAERLAVIAAVRTGAPKPDGRSVSPPGSSRPAHRGPCPDCDVSGPAARAEYDRTWANAPMAQVWRGAPNADWPEHFKRITGVYPDNTEMRSYSTGIETLELFPGGWVVHHHDDGGQSICKLVQAPGECP